ncbi:MAG: hypothetical protein GY943_20750 [Chloroflexi bacterium]|nr:hypothetical protein [Chloroflexota bacterium]
MMTNNQPVGQINSLWINGRVPTSHTPLVLPCPAWRPGKLVLAGLSGL